MKLLLKIVENSIFCIHGIKFNSEIGDMNLFS